MNIWNQVVAYVEAWPLAVRCVGIGFVALLVAAQINRAIDRFAYQPRGRDPWQPAPDGQPPRSRLDRLPILGWWRLRRESSHHGRLFWLRPLLIELCFPPAIVGLYCFELAGGLYPIGGPLPPIATLYAQFAAHACLVALMTIATFIDFDEQTIPDEVTLVGTSLGVVGMSLLPMALMPTIVSIAFVPHAYHVVFTTATMRQEWTAGLGGPASWPAWADTPAGLGLTLACLCGWWLAALPKIWTMRKGPIRAVRWALASVVRYKTWRLPSLCLASMVLAVAAAYFRGGWYWQGAMSSVIGLTAAGGFTWAIRLVASRALGMEALGFGDVTLMAMLGAFLGWQTSLLLFFLAPITALFVAVAQWVATRRHDIAFGPYLCLAAVVLIVGWRQLWHDWAVTAFAMGLVLPAIVVIAIVLLGVLLTIWQMIKRLAA